MPVSPNNHPFPKPDNSMGKIYVPPYMDINSTVDSVEVIKPPKMYEQYAELTGNIVGLTIQLALILVCWWGFILLMNLIFTALPSVIIIIFDIISLVAITVKSSWSYYQFIKRNS